MNRLLIGAAFLCSGIAPALAQESEPEILGTVILGGLIPTGQLDYARAYSVDIVTEEELEDAGDISVAEFLARRPGISMSRAGPAGGTTTLRVRGLGSQYIAVRIDGIDVTDPSNTQIFYDFGQLTTSGISRIEILKGSQSAAYGSEAVGGVINIVTQRAEGPGTEASIEVEGGSHDTFRGSLGAATRTELGELAFSLSRIDTDGFSAAAEGTEDDGFEQTFVTLRGAVQASDAVRLGFSAFRRDSEAEFDESFPALRDGTPDEVAETDAFGRRAFAEIDGGGLYHELSVSRFDVDRISTADGVESRFEGERAAVAYTATAEFAAGSFAFGAEHTREDFASGGADGDQETTGVFGEVVYALRPETELAFALRHDLHSEFDDFTSVRAAVAHDLRPDLTLRAVAATGFRAPSLYERFGPYGSDELEPEESRTLELGADYVLARGSVGATLFFTEVDELIQYVVRDPVTFAGGYEQVPGTTRTRGVELEARVDLTRRIGAFGNYTYTEAEAADGSRLLRVPRHDLTLGLEAEVGARAAARLTLRHVADVVDFGGRLDDYTVADAAARYRISDRSEAFLRVENLFDEDYETVLGYGTSGRAVFAGLRASF